MTPSKPSLAARWRAVFILGLVLAPIFSASTFAGPGAHGPNGEHLDAPAAAASASTEPGFETHSELFEVVARLHAEELSLFIDRFDSNAPVLGAAVEVESAGHKANATFHADLGDYSVTDPVLLATMQKTGEHALVLTVVAGDDADLLDGTLVVGNRPLEHDDDAHRRDGLGLRTWLLIGVVTLAVVSLLVLFARNRRPGERTR